MTNQEAAAAVGKCRAIPQQDLYVAIAHSEYPKRKFCMQVMPEAYADKLSLPARRADQGLDAQGFPADTEGGTA